MGGLWQAIVFGFGGVRPCGDVLIVDPHLPSGWRHLGIRLAHRGAALHIGVDHQSMTSRPTPPSTSCSPDSTTTNPTGGHFEHHTDHWERSPL